jgi:hypothetical protein
MVVLERLRDKLRDLGFVPMVFNFDKPESIENPPTPPQPMGLATPPVGRVIAPIADEYLARHRSPRHGWLIFRFEPPPDCREDWNTRYLSRQAPVWHGRSGACPWPSPRSRPGVQCVGAGRTPGYPLDAEGTGRVERCPARLIAAPFLRHDGGPQEGRAAVANPELIIAIAVIAALALLFGFGIWWLWWRLPKRQADRLRLTIRDPKARADVEDNFRKTIGQALGGAAVLIGAGFAFFQFLQQQKTTQEQQQTTRTQQQIAQSQLLLQQQAALQQQQASLQQQQAAHDLLISNQVSKGFEQLAGDKLAMRLGGIYALEGVMNTSEQYRAT